MRFIIGKARSGKTAAVIREIQEAVARGEGRMLLINIGFGNLISAGRLLAVVGPDSAPTKRMMQDARDRVRMLEDDARTASVATG